jgi:hypothetical protein
LTSNSRGTTAGQQFEAHGRGQVGTLVERLAPGVYEVEFSDDSGRTYASLALSTDQLIQLHHEPHHQAA